MDTISAHSLALWLSWPSVLGEFRPAPLLGHPAESSPAAPWPEGDPRVVDIYEPFYDSVRSCMDGHENVAVSTSGGLDSLAVLVAAATIAAADGRRILAAVSDLTDDAGGSPVPVVQRLIEATGLRNIDLHICGADEEPNNSPTWRPAGPDLDALPAANRLLAERAADWGASVLLGGNGSDETLGAVRYLLGAYAQAAAWPAARSYWADSVGARREAYASEALAAVAPLLPRRLRTFLYVALEWPELCTQPEAPTLIQDHLRARVSAWSSNWVKELVQFHATHHRTWAQAAAWDAIYPLTILDGPGPIPLRHPFLTPAFLAAVRRLPIARRYDPALPHAYWRQKAQVVALLSCSVRGELPTAKATFRTTLANRYAQDKSSGSTLIEAGVLSPKHWSSESDPLLVSRVNALEGWCRVAVSRGHRIEAGVLALTG